MFSKINALQFIASFLPSVLFYIKQWRLQESLSSTVTNVTAAQMFQRLPGCQFPSEIPATGNKTETQKRCVVYSKDIHKKSRYQCGNCEQKPGLCLTPCFMI